jgi:hypothetical protein
MPIAVFPAAKSGEPTPQVQPVPRTKGGCLADLLNQRKTILSGAKQALAQLRR